MRKLVAVVTLLSGITVTVWLAAGPGDVVPNRVVECEATATPSLRAKARDAGVFLARHFQVRTGARRNVLADGGVEFILGRGIADDVRVKDWNECSVDPCTTAPALCEQTRFDSALPFTVVQPKCVRRKADAGVNGCQRLLPDGGGTPSDGYPCNDGCNAMRRAEAVLDADCEAVACGVTAGESALRVLDVDAED